MGGYIFASVILGASWLLIASPFLMAVYAVYTLVMEAKAAKAKKVKPAAKYMREARQAIKFARQYRAMGCPLAANEAIKSALSFRKAAHSFWFYGE